MLNLNNFFTLLTAALPFLFAWGAMTLYGILSQVSWNDTLKEVVADFFVILAALGCAYAVTSQVGYLAVFLSPVAMIGTYYFAKESALLNHWSLILQEGFFVVQDGKIYLFGMQVPPHARITTPETPIAPLHSIGQVTQPLAQIKTSQDDPTQK